MKTYTQIKNRELRALANKKIQKDLDYIQGQVSDLLGSHLKALLLCGSFGRGEGAVTFENDQVHIVNDYDFTVVFNNRSALHYLFLYKKFSPLLENLSHTLAKQLKIKQVDLSPKPLSYFKGNLFFKEKNRLKIENYEVKNGHVLIWPQGPGAAKQNPARHMPHWQAEDIPLFEGTWLFRNRGLGLVLAALYFNRDMSIAPRDRKNFIIECNKALLAIGDSLLLLKGQYHHLYARRLGIIQGLYLGGIPDGENLRQAYIKALKFKLNPDFDAFDHMDLTQYWYRTLDMFEKFFHFFEQFRLGSSFESWTVYADLDRPENSINPRAAIGKIIRQRPASLDDIRCVLARSCPGFSISLTALVLFAAKKDGQARAMMEKAAELMGISLTHNLDCDWKNLARALIFEIHPGGEAGRVLVRKL